MSSVTGPSHSGEKEATICARLLFSHYSRQLLFLIKDGRSAAPGRVGDTLLACAAFAPSNRLSTKSGIKERRVLGLANSYFSFVQRSVQAQSRPSGRLSLQAPPRPLTRKRVLPPPRFGAKEEGHTRCMERRMGEPTPIRTKEETLWYSRFSIIPLLSIFGLQKCNIA